MVVVVVDHEICIDEKNLLCFFFQFPTIVFYSVTTRKLTTGLGAGQMCSGRDEASFLCFWMDRAYHSLPY